MPGILDVQRLWLSWDLCLSVTFLPNVWPSLWVFSTSPKDYTFFETKKLGKVFYLAVFFFNYYNLSHSQSAQKNPTASEVVRMQRAQRERKYQDLGASVARR